MIGNCGRRQRCGVRNVPLASVVAARRRALGWAWVGLVVVSCAGGPSAPTPIEDQTYWTTPDGSTLQYDFQPGASDGPSHGVVVLLHGYTSAARASMADWSGELQTAGVSVLNADWSPRGPELAEPTAQGAVGTPSAVACAIDHARELAKTAGGDAMNVSVVAVSAGAYFGTLTALAWDRVDRSGCDAPPGPPPDQVIALAGAYDAARRGPLANALGRSPGDRTFLDPFEYLTGGVETRIGGVETRFVLIHGGDDPIIPSEVATDFAVRADAVGIDVELHLIPGGQHFEFGSPGTEEGGAALDIITSLTLGRAA